MLTPDVSETLLDVRGFHKKSPAAQEMLETVGRTFLAGYGHAVQAATTAEAEEQLETVPTRFRGFAYEGAAMGLAVLDGLPFGGRRRVEELLAGRGDRHRYMVYVGVGWAMARLPKFCWPRADSFDPLLRWLILDGYGFHQAYFRTRSYVDGHFRDPDFEWGGDRVASYANRAIDQGIGRALWFVAGTDPAEVVRLIKGFPEPRRADLVAGTGLASCYAGGADADELRALREGLGDYLPALVQGCAFAAEARVRAGLVVEHNEIATEVICGMTPQEAAEITQRTRPERPVDELGVPAYETWRRDIGNEVLSVGGVNA
ncbi:DUF1702 family protein [Saccharopolyspora indica]|nr:DUF1702 family protein [Saccharopolyspora indica]MDA3646985.1 DUF1702 family protein [Saccharopolyspora indica]